MDKIIVILGPTATGKTRTAALVAHQIGGEVISADSRQVYRSMDIGTGKDLEDYLIEGERVPYHLIDIVEPGAEYNVFRFRKDFERAFNDITGRNKVPVVCGGTGLYIDAIVSGYRLEEVPLNPPLRNRLEKMSLDELTETLKSLKDVHNVTDTEDRERATRAIEIETYYRENPSVKEELISHPNMIFGIDIPRGLVRERITSRLKVRLDEGMIEEVRGLLDRGITTEQLKFYGLEYRYVTEYLEGKYSFDEMFRLLNTAIRQFAKRQMTWFRRMEKKGQQIHWIDGTQTHEERTNLISEKYTNESQ